MKKYFPLFENFPSPENYFQKYYLKSENQYRNSRNRINTMKLKFGELPLAYYFSIYWGFLKIPPKYCTWLRDWEILKHRAMLVPPYWMINGRLIRKSDKLYCTSKNHCLWELQMNFFLRNQVQHAWLWK